MGYRHSKTEILSAAVDAAFDEGMSRLTFGRLARRLGISDRIIVYYFPTKDEFIGEVLAVIGAHLREALGPVLELPVSDHRAFVGAVWPTLARTEVDPIFAVFFEASGLAAAGVEPYRTMAPLLVEEWVRWAEESLEGDVEHRRNEASAAIAVLDGLLLMRQLAGPDLADRSARTFVGAS